MLTEKDCIQTVFSRMMELMKADMEGRIRILPLKPGTVIRQDLSGEYDIKFTGDVVYELGCSEETEWISDEELKLTTAYAARIIEPD